MNTKLLSLETNLAPAVSPLRGIKETPSWAERPRVLLLCDGTGARQAEVRIPDCNLTPRVVELLDAMLDEIERERSGSGPAKLELLAMPTFGASVSVDDA